eukprot:2298278-Amphidinium_carterae.1
MYVPPDQQSVNIPAQNRQKDKPLLGGVASSATIYRLFFFDLQPKTVERLTDHGGRSQRGPFPNGYLQKSATLADTPTEPSDGSHRQDQKWRS